MKRPRRNHSAKFKAKVALAAIQGEKTLVAVGRAVQGASEPDRAVAAGAAWSAPPRCSPRRPRSATRGPDVKTLHAKIGQLALGERFFGRRARSHRRCERKAMIDATHDLPLVRQAQLLDLSRSTVYYQPQPTSDADLALMRRIDELHLEHPFAGSRMLRDLLNREGFAVGRKHVATLMRTMGIEALYQQGRAPVGRHPRASGSFRICCAA